MKFVITDEAVDMLLTSGLDDNDVAGVLGKLFAKFSRGLSVPPYTPSVCKAYDDCLAVCHRSWTASKRVSQRENKREDKENLPPTPPIRDTEGNTRDKTLTPPISPSLSSDEMDGLFDRFWSAYPRKVAKTAAISSFFRAMRQTRDRIGLFDKMMSALDEHKKSRDWTKDGGQFIPHPSTWLNQERWNDELFQTEVKCDERMDGVAGELAKELTI